MSDNNKESLPTHDTTTPTVSQDDHPASVRTSATATTSAVAPSVGNAALPQSALSELKAETQPQHQPLEQQQHQPQQRQQQQHQQQHEEQLQFLEQAAQPEAPFALTSVAAGTLSPGGTTIRTLQPQLQTQQQQSTLIQGATTLGTHATAVAAPGGGEISAPGVLTRSSRSYAQSHLTAAPPAGRAEQIPPSSFALSAIAPLHAAMGNSQIGVDMGDSAAAATGMATAVGGSLPAAAAAGVGIESSAAVAPEGGIQCTKRPWTKEEDDLLLKLVKHYGSKDWTGICREIPGRNRKQCRERYKNHLEGNVKKGAWTQEEDNLIFEWQKKVGNKWSVISQHLPNRTDNAVKNRYWSATRSRERKAKKEAKKRAATMTTGHQQEDKKMKAAVTTSAGTAQAPAIGFVGGIPQAHQALPPTPTTPDVTSTTASVDATPTSEIGLEQASRSAATEDPEGDKKVKAKNKKEQFSV